MAQFKFELDSSLGLKTIVEPIGWDTRKPALDRNDTYHGIFTSYTITLTFINGDLSLVESDNEIVGARDYLNELYDLEGVEAECTIYFYEKNNTTKEWELQDSGVLDFYNRNVVSTIRGGGIELPVLDTSFKTVLKSREDTDINYNDSVGLDGQDLGEAKYYDCLIKGMPNADNDIDTNIFKINYEDDGSARNIIFGLESDYNNDSFQSIVGREYGGSELPLSIIQSDCYYYSKAISEINFTYDIDYKIESNQTVTDWLAVFRVYKVNFDDTLPVLTILNEEIRESPATWNINGNHSVTLQANEGIVFYGYHVNIGIAGSVNAQFEIINSSLKTTFIQSFPETTSKVTFPYEVISRLKESMTGDNTPIDAPIFNRPDTANPSIEYGKYSLYSLMNGKLIRNFTPEESSLSFQFKQLYLQLDAIFNIGIAIEGETVIVREKKDFYSDDIVHTFDKADVVVDTIEKSIDTDHYYSSVVIGYAKSAYEEISGLLEYQNQSTWNTALGKINNILEQVTEVLTGYGLEFARQKQKDVSGEQGNATTDTQWDNDLMMLDTVYDGGYVQRDKEGFSSVKINGSEVVTPLMNLSITPAQNIRRHAWMMLTGLQKYADKKIKFNTSDNVVKLETTSDEGVTVEESADIAYNELEAPIFSGTLIECEVVATLAIYKKIKANPYGLIKVWNEVEEKYNYGWIKSFGIESVDKSTNLTLIEARSVSEVLKSWLWNDGKQILWNSGEFIALND